LKKLALAAATLAALTFGAPANAADMPIKPYYAPPPAVFNWTGFYVGGNVGYGLSSTDFVLEPAGIVGGVQLGYNWQMSRNWVFGLEGDITFTDMNDSVAGVHSHVDYMGTLRARLGYTFDSTMLYATGGLAYARFGVAGVHDSDLGWAFGLGMEWALTRNWSAKAEYLYATFSDLDIQTVKVGVNYRFSTY